MPKFFAARPFLAYIFRCAAIFGLNFSLLSHFWLTFFAARPFLAYIFRCAAIFGLDFSLLSHFWLKFFPIGAIFGLKFFP
jgi:hypothetical protein